MSLLRCYETGEDVEQCCLAGTADAQQGNELALMKFDIDILYDRSGTIPFCYVLCA